MYQHKWSPHLGAKCKIAGEITRIHSEVTGAPAFFTQVIFTEVKAGDWFIGIFVSGHIRAGRAAVDKARMIKLMSEGVARAADVKDGRAIWIYLNELPPRQMIEFGHVLPEPGDESAWTAALPEEDRAFMKLLLLANLTT